MWASPAADEVYTRRKWEAKRDKIQRHRWNKWKVYWNTLQLNKWTSGKWIIFLRSCLLVCLYRRHSCNWLFGAVRMKVNEVTASSYNKQLIQLVSSLSSRFAVLSALLGMLNVYCYEGEVSPFLTHSASVCVFVSSFLPFNPIFRLDSVSDERAGQHTIEASERERWETRRKETTERKHKRASWMSLIISRDQKQGLRES